MGKTYILFILLPPQANCIFCQISSNNLFIKTLNCYKKYVIIKLVVETCFYFYKNRSLYVG